jgi:hypothetical protein
MADGGGERRMVFDTRGRRKHVVRVVYAVLALLMGGSLFLTVGPFNIGELFGNGRTSSDASVIFHEQSERIENRLAKDPTDENLLLSLTRARIQAGNAQTEIDPQTGAPGAPSSKGIKDFEAALESWSRYLKQAGDDPNPAAAQLVAQTFFSLAERGSSTLGNPEENLETAVKAQRIAAKAQPNVGSLSSLAIYEYFNGNFAAGDKASKRAVARTVSKPEAKAAEKQLDEYRKRAKQYVTQVESASKAEQRAGGEQPENPLGGFGSRVPPGGE